ncbi:MAG: hypothetical protein RLY30_1448 [Pseudomonadota bacterium]|jgi:alkylation response protein AidB-like acyl-CoA dehydrogenase
MMLAVSEDTQMLAQSATDLFTAQDYPGVIRSQRAMGRAATGFGPTHWQAAVDLGWTGVAVPDALGGLDFPLQGLFGLFEAGGQALAGLPMLTQLVLAPRLLSTVSGSWGPCDGAVEQLLSGTELYGFAVDESSRHAPDHCHTQARQTSSGWVLSGSKRYSLDVTHAHWILVTARLESTGELALFRVAKDTPGLHCEPCALIDLRSRSHVSLQEVALGPDALMMHGDACDMALHQALLLGRACLSAELVGIAQSVFNTTLDYLQQREQFDRKLGSFQALQHRMARLHAEIQLARAGVLGAFELLSSHPHERSAARATAMAKYKAGEVSDLATNEATQLHGGMGVTDELNIGLYLKRARVAENTLGDQAFQMSALIAMEDGSR